MALTSQSLSSQNRPTNLSPDKQREMLRQMLTIHRFEERASADYLAGKIYGVVHCYIGEEAVAVGVCSALAGTDRIISTHRGHGHCIAKGADLNRMMAELYGRQTGYCKGKGGSMHLADFGIGMLGANGIVADGIPGIVVDGNDVFAVHQAASAAIDRARSGGGPTLIECKTYRWRAHTERKGQPDPRDATEIEAWRRKDPIAFLERQLRDQGELDDAGLQAIERDIIGAIEAAVAFAEASPFPLPEQATDDVFSA